MIFTINLKGGIGNQLFQLAYGDYLSSIYNVEVEFNTTSFETDTYGRQSILSEIHPHKKGFLPDGTKNIRYFKENEKIIQSGAILPDLPQNEKIDFVIFDGYWQTCKTITDKFANHVKKVLEQNCKKKASSLYERVTSDPHSLGIHIRRHDYKHHGIADENYYIASTNEIISRRAPNEVFVFTDEPNYVRTFLKIPNIKVTLVNTGDALVDLGLMSLCSNFVIANSSYSWWAAKLSNNSTYICYPTPWDKNSTPSPFLIPENWICIPEAIESNKTFKEQKDAVSEAFFKRDLELYISQNREGTSHPIIIRKYFEDKTSITNFDAHYVYHTSWAARRLLANPKQLHIDIGSDIRFATIASAFQRMKFIDIRPLNVNLRNLECQAGDILNLALPNRSVQSLSCMHVVEHIGLGRYGDSIDYYGATKAINELQRVLMEDGKLYFVVPVGSQKTVFHAHRVFAYEFIINSFSELNLLEFSLITDSGQFIENASSELSNNQNYGCGCFLFTRQSKSN